MQLINQVKEKTMGKGNNQEGLVAQTRYTDVNYRSKLSLV